MMLLIFFSFSILYDEIKDAPLYPHTHMYKSQISIYKVRPLYIIHMNIFNNILMRARNKTALIYEYDLVYARKFNENCGVEVTRSTLSFCSDGNVKK